MVALMTANPLGNRIRTLRESRGLSQGQLAAYARVKQAWLSKVEAGKTDNPRVSDLARVARVLGETVEYLQSGRREQGEAVIVEPEKVAIARRLLRYPLDVLARIEQTAGMWAGEISIEPLGGEDDEHGRDGAGGAELE
jgi:transcriptional regulator with XRE-family HTH domain